MRKVAYLLILSGMLVLAGFAFAQTSGTSGSSTSGSSATSDDTMNSNTPSSHDTDPSSMSQSRVLVGVVDKIDRSAMTITLKSMSSGAGSDVDNESDKDSNTGYGSKPNSGSLPGTSGSSEEKSLGAQSTFTFTSQTTFAGKDSKSMTASDIKEGDRVRIQLDSSNTILSIKKLGK